MKILKLLESLKIHEVSIRDLIKELQLPDRELLVANLVITISNHFKLNKIMKTIDELIAAVQAEKTVTDSAVALLNGLSSQLKVAIATGDPAKLQALSDSIDAQTKELSDAVAANTPAASETAPTV